MNNYQREPDHKMISIKQVKALNENLQTYIRLTEKLKPIKNFHHFDIIGFNGEMEVVLDMTDDMMKVLLDAHYDKTVQEVNKLFEQICIQIKEIMEPTP